MQFAIAYVNKIVKQHLTYNLQANKRSRVCPQYVQTQRQRNCCCRERSRRRICRLRHRSGAFQAQQRTAATQTNSSGVMWSQTGPTGAPATPLKLSRSQSGQESLPDVLIRPCWSRQNVSIDSHL